MNTKELIISINYAVLFNIIQETVNNDLVEDYINNILDILNKFESKYNLITFNKDKTIELISYFIYFISQLNEEDLNSIEDYLYANSIIIDKVLNNNE